MDSLNPHEPYDISPDVVPIQNWSQIINTGAPISSTGNVGQSPSSGLVDRPSGLSPIADNIQSPNFVSGLSGWRLNSNGDLEANNGNFRGDITGATGTFSGTITGGSLNIPDSTTASSFHVDSLGNAWWGTNVATGYATAPARILATGEGNFKNVYIGGSSIQYIATDQGVFSFGDGSDGAGVADGSTALAGASLAANVYTLTRDVYYTNLTVSTGVTIKPSGYRIFGTGILTLNGTATIQTNGNAGGNGGNGGDAGGSGGTAGTAGTAGAALADGYLKGSLAGVVGGAGAAPNNNGSNGNNGSNTLNSIGSSATNGANAGGGGAASGGNAAGGTGGGGGTAGTVTASNVRLIANWHLATLLDISSTGATVKFDNSASSGSGGGGGAGGNRFGVGTANGGGGGGGGGSGSSGGIMAIYFRSIIVGASASMTCNGGKGGNGGNGGNGNGTNPDFGGGGGGGGGGAPGNGGQLILVYNVLSNSGTISANAGAIGTGGTKGNKGGGTAIDGTAGTNSAAGVAGNVRQFALSQ